MKQRTEYLISKLKEVVDGNRHSLYTQSTNLQSDYTTWITGDGLNAQVRRLRRREDDKDFKERQNITTQLLPRIMGNARDSFSEAFRNNNIKIEVSGEDKALEIINEQMLTFSRFDSLDEYWGNKFLNLSFTDPNAWIITKFYEEKTAPLVVNSSQMLMYEYVNDVLDYVCFQQGSTYYLWSMDTVLTCMKKEQGQLKEGSVDDYGKTIIASTTFKDKNGNEHIVDYSEVYPYNEAFAVQVGYIPHIVTDGLYVAPTEKARPDITRLINLCSEYDVNMLLHVFLQKFEYAQPCTNRNCTGGISSVDGSTCEHCKGTGFEPSHTSALDTVKVPLPFSGNPAELMDLSKLSHYTSLPIDVLQHQRDEIHQCIKSIEVTIAGSDIFTRKDLAEAATATEVNSNTQKQNNTLYPFAVKYCQTYQFFVEKIADIKLISDQIDFSYWIDKNMLRESVASLLSQISAAQGSGVPEGIIADMYDEVAYVMYLNRPEQQKKHEVRKRINMYFATPLQEKVSSLSLLPMDNEIRIKATYTEWILLQAELINEVFYDLGIEQQDNIINEIVLLIKQQITVASPRFETESIQSFYE